MTEQTINESPWHQFLKAQGAHIDTAEANDFIQFTASPNVLPDQFMTPIAHLGLLKVTGEDAVKFLHSQLTNDVEHLSQQQARLAGYCSAKGRLLATFLMWKEQDSIFLETSMDLLAALQKRLKMFVLRAKVSIEDVQSTTASLGLYGQAVQVSLSHLFGTLPTLPYEKITTALGTLIALPSINNIPRYQWTAAQAVLSQYWPELTKTAPPLGNRYWSYLDIKTGTPWITPKTQEAFVPQMLNYEIIGGISFKKGCYPGQEIVARTQYLGKIKRRMVLFHTPSAAIHAGDEIFAAADPDQPCGKIVNAVSIDQQNSVCLAEIKLAALDNDTIHLHSAQGNILETETLPYNIQDNNSPE